MELVQGPENWFYIWTDGQLYTHEKKLVLIPWCCQMCTAEIYCRDWGGKLRIV